MLFYVLCKEYLNASYHLPKVFDAFDYSGFGKEVQDKRRLSQIENLFLI